MKILIISFHYEPDLCAGSFRTTALANHLRNIAAKNIEIEVITTMPNRYASYIAEAKEYEHHPGFKIRRIVLPKHRSGMLDQAKAFLYFAKEVNRLVGKKNYSLVYATSSRLMAAALGAWIARKTCAKLYLDIRDLFVDTITELFPKKIVFFIKPIFSLIEKKTFNYADQINLVSRGFQQYIQQRYPSKKLSWFTNGIDQEFIDYSYDKVAKSDSIITVLYAGNIGEGQGLHKIIPQLACKLAGRVKFKIVGDGGRVTQLIQAVKSLKCSNVEILSPINRTELLKEYKNADVLFLHLNDYDAFRKVLPSKLFEYATTCKPIWAGVAGHAADFILTEIDNAQVFAPCNVDDGIEAFDKLMIANVDRKRFIEKYKRNNIMQQMAEDLLLLV